jgi:hypothetical protein
MASILCKRCLKFFKSVAKNVFKLDAPVGYEDDTGFHWVKNSPKG